MNLRELLISIGFESGGTGPEIDKIDGKVDKLKKSFISLNGILSTLFAAGFIRSLVNTADNMQNLQAQVGNSIGDMTLANAKFNELAQHANATRADLDAYVGTWAKMNQGIRRFGGSTDDTTKFVDTLSAAFAVNGTAAESARAALFQLGQTMQSGVVQGEEMNSFLDAQGSLAVEAMEAIAGTVPAYKKMQQQGKITAQMLMEAVNKQYPKYMKQLRDMPMTLRNVWSLVTNDISVAINNVNDHMKGIPRTAKFLIQTWDDLKTTVSELVESMGGLDNTLVHLARVAAPMATLIAVLAGFKVLSMLATPIGMVTGLATAIGLLYDDYMTWKEGGDSFIDWAKWQTEIRYATTAINWLIDAFKSIIGEKDGTKAALQGLATAIGVLYSAKMISGIGSLIAALGGVGNAALLSRSKVMLLITAGLTANEVWDKFINQEKDENGNTKPTTAGGNLIKDSPLGKLYDTLDGWNNKVDSFLGKGKNNEPPVTGTALTPGVVPSRAVTQTVNINAPINVTQQPGESGSALAQRIVTGLQSTSSAGGGFDPESLLVNGGSK